jgi:hypothetical protein
VMVLFHVQLSSFLFWGNPRQTVPECCGHISEKFNFFLFGSHDCQ